MYEGYASEELYGYKLIEEAINTILWVQTSITFYAHFLGKQTTKTFCPCNTSFIVRVFLLIFSIDNQAILREKN